MIISSYILANADATTIQKRFLDISKAINGGIEFGSPSGGSINISGAWVNITTPSSADTEFEVDHNLGYIPTGMLVVYQSAAGSIYGSSLSNWTTKKAFFKCSTASLTLKGFVI